MPNVPLHQALTDDKLDLHVYFGEDDDSDGVSEYLLLSEEEYPFTSAAAKDLLYTLAEQNKQQAELQSCWTKKGYFKRLQRKYSSRL